MHRSRNTENCQSEPKTPAEPPDLHVYLPFATCPKFCFWIIYLSKDLLNDCCLISASSKEKADQPGLCCCKSRAGQPKLQRRRARGPYEKLELKYQYPIPMLALMFSLGIQNGISYSPFSCA